MIQHRIYVGCVGEGVFRSLDHGKTFRRACDGMAFVECDVRALLVDPKDPQTLHVGCEEGIFVSRDGADRWERLPAPVEGMRIWSLHLDARRPGRIVAGTSPAGLISSEDGGKSWRQGEANLQKECPRIRWTRTTCITSDPGDPDHLWAGVEIDGVHESRDGGRNWKRRGTGRTSEDIHGLLMLLGKPGHARLLATTNRDLNVSDDGGETWQPTGLERQLPWNYTRGLAQKAGSSEVIFLGTGDGPPGSEGTILRSPDGGNTWERVDMPGLSNSTIWNFATNPADPELIYASSVSGEVFRSLDGGSRWEKLAREFGEVRGLAWAPG